MEKGDFFSNFLAQKDLFRGNVLNPESGGIAYSHNFLSKVLGWKVAERLQVVVNGVLVS